MRTDQDLTYEGLRSLAGRHIRSCPMNYRTTFILLVVVALAGAGYYFGPTFVPNLPWAPPAAAGAGGGAADIIKNDITPEKLTKITLHSATNDVSLERGPGGEWSLKGNWPVRKPETNELVHLLTHLHSRFVPQKGDAAALAHVGLDKPTVTVTAASGRHVARIEFRGGEGRGKSVFEAHLFMRVDNSGQHHSPGTSA